MKRERTIFVGAMVLVLAGIALLASGHAPAGILLAATGSGVIEILRVCWLVGWLFGGGDDDRGDDEGEDRSVPPPIFTGSLKSGDYTLGTPQVDATDRRATSAR